MHRIIILLVTCACNCLIANSSHANEETRITFYPVLPTSETLVTYDLAYPFCDIKIENISITPAFYLSDEPQLNENGVVKITISDDWIYVFDCQYKDEIHQVLGYLESGTYDIEIYQLNETSIPPSEELLFTSELFVDDRYHHAYHESPAEYSIQSGIGIIRGWACDTFDLIITIDGKDYIPSYGLSRDDTIEECGDSNNGYSLLFNWNLLEEGLHSMSISYGYKGGRDVQSSKKIVEDLKFNTVKMDEEYYTNLEQQIIVNDFPAIGSSVILEWSTSDQNFKIIQYNQ